MMIMIMTIFTVNDSDYDHDDFHLEVVVVNDSDYDHNDKDLRLQVVVLEYSNYYYDYDTLRFNYSCH